VTNKHPCISEAHHKSEYDLFHNPDYSIDGSTYGISLKKLGVDVHGHSMAEDISPSNDVLMANVDISEIRARPQ
jgi:hypothetical protein